MPNGYTRIQIILHWLIFILIAAQFIFHDAISEAFRSLVRTGELEPTFLMAQHIVTGIAVLLLVGWRLVIKVRRGAPPLPEHEPKLLKLTAHLTHIVLYVFMVLVPVSGLIAWFSISRSAADVHEVAKSMLLVLIGLHVLGALFQKFVLKSDVLARMVRPNP